MRIFFSCLAALLMGGVSFFVSVLFFGLLFGMGSGFVADITGIGLYNDLSYSDSIFLNLVAFVNIILSSIVCVVTTVCFAIFSLTRV